MINLVPLAIKILKHAMRRDPNYAWSWQCNLAMIAHDTGASIDQANRRAANFMNIHFDVDTLSQYEAFEKQLNPPE